MNNPITSTFKLLGTFAKFRNDGFENILTGLGVKGKDKRNGGEYKRKPLTRAQLEAFHDASDIGKLVVNKVPELGTKKWITHKLSPEDGGPDMVNKLVDEDDRLLAKDKFKKAWSWARLYGGSIIYMSVNDGLTPDQPLNPNRIFSFNSLTVFHKDEATYGDIDWDIDSPNYGLPIYYNLGANANVAKIHHSRVLRFEGSPLSEQGFRNNSYWDDSILNVIHEVCRDYDAAYNGVFNALQDFSVDVLKMKDLADMCQGEETFDLLKKRLTLMQLSKSVMSAIALDAEGESFEKLERAFANVDKVLDKCDKRLQMATGLPHTVLFGEGSAGSLSGKGESEQNTLNDLVSGEQDRVLTRNLNIYGEVVQLAKQGPTNGKYLKSWTYIYNPLTEPSEKEKSETRLNMARADEIYLASGALSNDEVANSRFGGDEYSIETSIDSEARREQLETSKLDPKKAEEEIKDL